MKMLGKGILTVPELRSSSTTSQLGDQATSKPPISSVAIHV